MKNVSIILLMSFYLVACGGSSESSKKVKVEPVNIAPTISGSLDSSVFIYNDYSFSPAIADANGDTLVVTAENLPSWAVLNSETGSISGIPEINDIGTYEKITLSVSDCTQTTSLPAFNIQVKSRPIFDVADQNVSTNEDASLAINITAQTVFDDSLPITYSLRQAPSNDNITGQYPNLTYASNESFFGDDSFSYVIQ